MSACDCGVCTAGSLKLSGGLSFGARVQVVVWSCRESCSGQQAHEMHLGAAHTLLSRRLASGTGAMRQRLGVGVRSWYRASLKVPSPHHPATAPLVPHLESGSLQPNEPSLFRGPGPGNLAVRNTRDLTAVGQVRTLLPLTTAHATCSAQLRAVDHGQLAITDRHQCAGARTTLYHSRRHCL